MNARSELLNTVNIVPSLHSQRGEKFNAWTPGFEIYLFDRTFLRFTVPHYSIHIKTILLTLSLAIAS